MAIPSGEWLGGGVAFAGVLVSAVFGKPAWKLARMQVATAEATEAAEATRKMAADVAKLLGGNMDPGDIGVGDDNPSIRDLLVTISEQNRETSALAAAFAHHVRDGHGGTIPVDVIGRMRPFRQPPRR